MERECCGDADEAGRDGVWSGIGIWVGAVRVAVTVTWVRGVGFRVGWADGNEPFGNWLQVMPSGGSGGMLCECRWVAGMYPRYGASGSSNGGL